MPGVGRGPEVPPGRGAPVRGAPGRGAPGRGAPGRGPPAPAAGRGPAAPGVPVRSVSSRRWPGRGMPWDGANGLLPGRGPPWPRSPSPRPRGRGMPCEVAKGLLPGRGPEAPGRGAPGRGAEDSAGAAGAAGFSSDLGAGAAGLLAAGAASAAGFSAAGAAGAGAAGAGAAGAAGAGAAGAGAAGLFAAGAASAAGFSAAGAAGAGAAGRGADFAAPESPAAGLPAASGNAPRSFLTTGASIVEDAERTNSPSSCSFATASFEVMPSSLASSCTRTLATFLLSQSAPSQARTVYLLRASTAGAGLPITEHNKVLIVGYSSLGTHRVSIRFQTRFQVGRFRGVPGWDPPLELRTTVPLPRNRPAPGRHGRKPGVSQRLRGMLPRGATRHPGQTCGGFHRPGRQVCHPSNPAPAASEQPGHPSSCSQCMSVAERDCCLPQAAPIPRAPAVAGRRTVTRP